MLALWLPRRWLARHYRVLVRPTLQGEFLIFPFGWKQGGKGYAFSKSQKRHLEQPQGRWWDVPVLLTGVALVYASFLFGLPVLIALLAGMSVWGIAIQRRYTAHAQRLLTKARPAGVRLSRQRYRLEYASQLREAEIWAGWLVAAGLGIGSILILLRCLSNGWWVGTLFSLAAIAAAVVAARYYYRLNKARLEAFRFSVHAGDPVDIPLT